MSSASGPVGGTTRRVVREIDQELGRLTKWERAAATERALLLSARAALAGVSQDEVAAYLAEHPGSWPADIAGALQVPSTNVSTHLNRGRHTRYERRQDGWYLRTRQGSDG